MAVRQRYLADTGAARCVTRGLARGSKIRDASIVSKSIAGTAHLLLPIHCGAFEWRKWPQSVVGHPPIDQHRVVRVCGKSAGCRCQLITKVADACQIGEMASRLPRSGN
jgi:hypothetical protein